MNTVFETTYQVLPSVCDADGYLGIGHTFSLFMDLASAHAVDLHIGYYDFLPAGNFWLTVKTQIHFFRRPQMYTFVTLRTWPEQPQALRTDRSYEIWQNGELCASGKTEWAVINLTSGQLIPMEDVFPKGLAFDGATACDTPYARIRTKFDGVEPIGTYTIRSTDIDVGRHMNNAAYVHALLGCLSVEEREKTPLTRMDVVFRAQSYEGETLELRAVPTEDGCDYQFSADGTVRFLARMWQ